jgi:anti-sigma factor RsiW
MKGEREVAGLRCSEVLARLSDYIDGDLAAEEVERLQQHLQGCRVCEAFGGSMAELVRSLRRDPGASAEGPPAGVAERLRERLRREPR